MPLKQGCKLLKTCLFNVAEAEDAKISSGGVSFIVDYRDGNLARMPSRLADRLDGAVTPTEDDNEVFSHFCPSKLPFIFPIDIVIA